MKLQIYSTNKDQPHGLRLEEDRLILTASRPSIIQPSEIMKVQTDSFVRVPVGYTLNISTAPELAERAGEIFPGLIVVDSYYGTKSLEVPVRNGGRNPLNLMPGQVVAIGYVTGVSPIEVEEFLPDLGNSKSAKKTGPSRKNPDFKFEIR
jgi:dUTPase